MVLFILTIDTSNSHYKTLAPKQYRIVIQFIVIQHSTFSAEMDESLDGEILCWFSSAPKRPKFPFCWLPLSFSMKRLQILPFWWKRLRSLQNRHPHTSRQKSRPCWVLLPEQMDFLRPPFRFCVAKIFWKRPFFVFAGQHGLRQVVLQKTTVGY